MDRRHFFHATVALGGFGALPAIAEEPLDRWFGELAKSPGLEARFEETKTLKLLRTPLESGGRLYFSPEGLFAKRTLSPRRTLLLLRDDDLLLADERGEKKFDLRREPRVGALVKSLSSVLRGDRAALERHYTLRFSEGARPRLVLTPREAELEKLVTRLELTFVGRSLESIEVLEASGDLSRTRLLEVDAERRFSSEEKQHAFRPHL